MINRSLNVLVACEESQVVCSAFRKLGHNAYSCDFQFCSGGHPEWHIVGDATFLVNGFCEFITCDSKKHYVCMWDLIIAHPPCTYMSKAGASFMFPVPGIVSEERLKLALSSKELFLKFLNANCRYIAVENPIPLKIVGLPGYTQKIQPFQFGHPFSKSTCLWLKGLPALVPTNVLTDYISYTDKVRSPKSRSKTFPGIAEAMALQWSNFILSV